jgi:hypothetical protein
VGAQNIFFGDSASERLPENNGAIGHMLERNFEVAAREIPV